MTRLITASEALRLPSAQLTDEEQKIADKLVGEINAAIEGGAMKRNGFEFTTNCTSPAAVFEVLVQLRDGGYEPQCMPDIQPSPFNPREGRLMGYKLVCVPGKDAIEAAKRMIQ